MIQRGLLSLILFFTTLMVSPAFAQATGDYDLSPRILNRIIGVEQDYERSVRAIVPEFRLVRHVGAHKPIKGDATVDVPILLGDHDKAAIARENAPQIIATLHHTRTGAPMDSCQAPCTLRSRTGMQGVVVLYRYGSHPVQTTIKKILRPPIYRTFLGFNEVDHQVERERCWSEFESLRVGVIQRDAEPCVRIPPRMPSGARTSGHCLVGFNISVSGEPVDVVAELCTDQVFCDATVEATQRWIYHPALFLGETVERPGVESRMTYRLSNREGAIIPEPANAELQPCIGAV